MRRIGWILLLLILCLSLPALAEMPGENLLQNPDFETGAGELPEGWARDMWRTEAGVSYLEWVQGGREGGHAALIENVSSNDARLIQSVPVMPDSIYRLSGWVKAEGCDPALGGASLTVLGAFADFPAVYDTAGEWVFLSSYILTDGDQTSLTIAPRVGFYSADTAGKAWFDDLSLSAAVLPDGAVALDVGDYTDSGANEPTAPAEAATSMPSLWLPMMLGFFGLVLCLLWMDRAGAALSARMALGVALGFALVIRLYLMITQPGYSTDMNCFFIWSQRMATVGPNAFYAPDYFCDYPPGYMYPLWITGGLLRLFGAGADSGLGRVLVKLMPLLFDLGTVALLFSLARRALSTRHALCVALLYALCPAVLMDGAIWGQVDAVLALGLLLTVALAIKGRWMAALPIFMVTVLMKPQALMAGPLGLAALALDLIGGEARKQKRREALIGAGIALGVAIVMLLPFLWGKEDAIGWLFGQYGGTLGSYAYATVNAANLYYLLGANWVPLDSMAIGGLTYGTIGTVLMGLAVAGVLAGYLLKRDKGLLPLFGALTYLLLFLFGVKMHERYLFPMFALLLYAYIKKPDWRLLAAFLGYAATFAINCLLVLQNTHLATGHGLPGMLLAIANLLLLPLLIWAILDKEPRPIRHSKPKPMPEPLPEGGIPRLKRIDALLLAALTLGTALVSFIGLGDTVAPQTLWQSTGASEEIVFDLGESRDFYVLYYGGISSRGFTLAFSKDGQTYAAPVQSELKDGACFQWKYIGITAGAQTLFRGRYVRMVTDGPSVSIFEIAFRTPEGEILPPQSIAQTGARAENAQDPWRMVDEAAAVPDAPSYMNSMYFDEIYHARTGYEHANGLSTYEWTHPPLGKVFIMWGIQLFGMTPFGWRFMGTLAGVLMVPVMYLLGKLLFKKAKYAALAALLIALDMMRLTQTRIATIDSYAVLFILLMYYFMFRYMLTDFFRARWKALVPLMLSGLCMGLGVASKWICIYAGIGLAVLFAWHIIRQFLAWRDGRKGTEAFPKLLLGTLLACVGGFIVVPVVIYYVSYIPHMAWEGGVSIARVLQTQESIFSYHANLVDTHAFRSPFYEWPLMLKPMYYYRGRDFQPEGIISTIMCMGNPAVWWAGLAAFFYTLWRWAKPFALGQWGEKRDPRPAMLLLAVAAQYVPWMLVPRSMFIYHYFGSLPFIILCMVYAFSRIDQARPHFAKWLGIGFVAVAALLFVGFYPIATGVPVPIGWADAMNWFSFLKLPGWDYRGWLYY